MGNLEAAGVVARKSNPTAAVMLLMDAVLDAVEAGGPMGVPAGTIYVAMQTVGISFNAFSGITQGLVTSGLMRSKGNLFFITDKGLKWLEAHSIQDGPATDALGEPITT